MISKITVLIFVLWSVLTVSQTPIRQHLKHFDLQGSVKKMSITYKTHQEAQDFAKDQNIFFVQKDSTFVEEYHFSKHGILTESKTASLQAFEWKKYELNNDSPYAVVTKTTVFEKKRTEDNFVLASTYFYDYKPNRTIEINDTNAENQVFKLKNTYDNKQNLILEENLSSGKSFSYKYDKNNKLISVSQNGKIIKTIENIYDKNNMLIENVTTDSGNQKTSIAYNDKGLKQQIKRSSGDTHTFKYTYDKDGNWVNCKVFFNEHLIEEEFRKIVYE